MKTRMCWVVAAVAAAAGAASAADGVWTAGAGVWTNEANWAGGVLPGSDEAAAFVGAGGAVTVPGGFPVSLSALYCSTNGVVVDWTLAGETNTLVAPALLRVDTNTLFLTAGVAGTDGFQKTGGGTLKITAANPLLSGSVQVRGGRLLIRADDNLGQAPASYLADAVVLDGASFGNDDPAITLAETRGVTLGAGGGYLFGRQYNQMVMASPITGAGSLRVMQQSGYVSLSNASNAYTGDTVVGSGGPGVFLAAPSALLILGANDVIPDGAGAGGLVIDGAWKGVLDLSGKSETVNRVTGLAGAVIANNATAGGVLHAGTDGADTSFAGVLQAGAVLDKVGAGTLTYSNTAACAGLIKVSAGAVLAGSGGALGQTSVQLDGGALKTPVQAAGQRFGGPLLLSQDALLDRTGAAAAYVWSGPLLPTNPAVLPVLTVSGGVGPLTVGATNRTAVFAIDASVAAGVVFTNRVWLETLPASSAWSIAPGSDVAIGTPGLLGAGPLSLTSYSARLVASDSLGAGGETVTVGGSGLAVWFDATRESGGRLADDASYAFAASNSVVLSGASAQVGFDGAGSVTYSGAISGSGALVKNGSGDARLQSASSFVGGVQVNAGRLLVSDDSQLGDSANAVTLAGGYLGSAGESPVTLARNVSASSGGLDVSGAALTLSGVASGTLAKRGAGTLSLGGAAGNPALDLYVTEGVAVLDKSGAQAVRHVLGVDTGAVVRLAGSGGNQIAGNATLTGGTLDLGGVGESVGTLASTSLSSRVTNSGGAAAAVTVGEGQAGGAFYGALADGAAAAGLTKTGTNLFTFAGAAGSQTSSGALRAEGGTLALGGGVRYVRVRPGATRAAGVQPALGELQLLFRGVPLAWPAGSAASASSSYSTNVSSRLIDNNARTQWQANGTPAWILVDLKTAVVCDGYRWFTCTDSADRDPLSWTVEVSADGVGWFTADARSNQTVTANRSALAGAFSFSGAWPCDALSASGSLSVSAGAQARLALPEDALGALGGAGDLVLAGGAALRVGDLSGFTGGISGSGRLLLGGSQSLSAVSAAETLTVVNDAPAPAAVTVGANGEAAFCGALADGAASLGLTKQGGGSLALLDAGSTYTGDTRVEQGTLAVVPPKNLWRFRYLRFNPTMTVGLNAPSSGYTLCIAELQLTSNGVAVAYPAGSTATTPYGNHSSCPPSKAIDGVISGTAASNQRWLSIGIPNPLTIDTKTGVNFDGYRVYESGINSADYGRTPTAWTLEGSHDGVAWYALCGETGAPVPGFTQNTGQSLGDFLPRPARFGLPLVFYGETNAAALKVAAVTARYLRFSVTDARYTSADFGNSGFQLSELQLVRNGAHVPYPSNTVASAPADGYNDYGGRYFPPQMAVDNALPVPGTDTNRWYSVAMVNPMTVDLGQPVTFDGYRWYTGPNGAGRDPLGWRLEISNNATNWYAVDVQTNQAVTLDRNALAGTWALNIPAGLRAADAIPDRSRTDVAAGATLRVEAGSETVGPLSGGGAVALAGGATLGINGFADATFTGGVSGSGAVSKSGAAAQALSGALAFSGEIVVEDGTLDLTGATLSGVTNIVLRGGLLTGAASVGGNVTVAFAGGAYRANLAVSGALAVTGSVVLELPDGTGLPYTQRLFAFGSADTATRAALDAATTLNVPAGYRATVQVTEAEARWAVATPGTVLMLK